MNLDFVLKIVNRKLIESQNPPLNTAEDLILRGIWEYKTYNVVAEEAGYSPGYFTNVVAPELFRRLSEITNERVTKKNCRALLESYVATCGTPEKTLPRQDPISFSATTLQDISPCFPSGAVALGSPFYIERSPIQEQVYAEIGKPGALVRIKAPQEMGKTSLLLRVLDYAHRLDYCTIYLNLQQVDQAILRDVNRFLRWLCASITRQLGKDSNLDNYWDEDIGSKISCTLYLRNYLLETIDSPLVLALDEVNQIFEHPEVAKDFFSLLRSWYEEAKRLPSSGMTPSNLDNIYWVSLGLWKELTTQFMYEQYNKYKYREVPLAEFLELAKQGKPACLYRLHTSSMTIEDYYEFPEGYMVFSPQFVPKRGREESSTNGYIVCIVFTPERDEIWIFDAENLNQNPLCKLYHPQLNLGLSLHTAWLQNISPRQANYNIPVKQDYQEAVEKLLNFIEDDHLIFLSPPEKGQLKQEIKDLFEKDVYPRF